MNFLLLLILSLLSCSKIVKGQQTKTKRLVCYFDAMSTDYQGYPHYFERRFLKALSNCTHLVYSSAQISRKTYELNKFNLNPKPSDLKMQFPHLKVLLCVGGDRPEFTQQYLEFLEDGAVKQQHFIENVQRFLKLNHFDGLDLAFPLPRNKPRNVHSSLGHVIKKIKKLFTGEQIIDANSDSHKLQYTKFVSDLRKAFAKGNLQLTMTVLPNVNSTWYFDIFKIHKNFDFINLFAFDFLTPDRNPEEADFTAPIYFKVADNRLPHYNIDFQVDYWIHNGCPVQKLNLGISTYGRAWKLTIDSGLTGIPVVESTNGAADPGKFTKTAGLLSWPEICIKLATQGVLRKVVDAEHKYGNYAFHPSAKDNSNGIWISFDDPEFAGIKADYVKLKGMGGVAVYDLNRDDFQKFCMGPVFPILTRISKSLGILHQINKHQAQFKNFTA